MDKPTTAGEGATNFVTTLIAGLLSLITGLAIMVVPLALIGLDLALGPQFIDSYAEARGIPLGGFGNLVPLAFSLATTGLQYALFDRLPHGVRGIARRSQVLMLVALVVALGDTAMDVGGVTSWRYPDDQAANIVPINPDTVWWFQAVLFGGLCLVHEPILQTVLGRFKGKLTDESFTGAVLVKAGVKAGGWILNTVKVVALPAGAVSMIFLDLVLTPQLGTNPAMTVTMWIASIGLTGFQYVLWEHRDNVGIKRLAKSDRAYLTVAWGLAVLDTCLDVIGYTTAIYGGGTHIVVIPDNPTWVWGLGAVLTGTLCFAGERMLREMLWRPKRDGRSGRSSSGGFEGFDFKS